MQSSIDTPVSDVTLNMMKKRVLWMKPDGKQETPLEAYARVAEHVSNGHAVYHDSGEVKKFKEKTIEMLSTGVFMPNTPTLVNAGFPNAQCSACFVLSVEDNLPSIYKAYEDQGLIQASGGGCVDGDTYIYTEKHGIIKIKDIPDFDTVQDYNTGCPIVVDKSGSYKTISYNENMNIFQHDEITHVWKFEVKQKDVRIIKFNSGEIKTSSWHPFLVVEGSRKHNDTRIVEKSAGELKEGDQILTLQPHHNLLSSNDEEFSWLLGYLVGDGSIDQWKQNHDRIRFFDQRLDILERVQKIFNKFGVSRDFTKDSRENCYIFTVTSSKNIENTNINHNVRGLFDRLQSFFDGNRFLVGKFKDIPSLNSFVAGLVDSDGYIGKDCTAISMIDQNIIYELQKWLALLGVRSTIRARTPKKDNWSTVYEIKYANCWNRLFPTVKKSRLPKNKYSCPSEVVKCVNIGDKDEEFYDFTVKNNNNYIAYTGKSFVIIHNTGFFLGNVRSAGTMASDRFVTRGPINWLKMYNENATHVAQGMREGANMAMLDVAHPDIVDFITCKRHGYKLTIDSIMNTFGVDEDEAKRIKAIIGIEKFNISVSVSDRFMQALMSGDDWYFIDPHSHQKSGSIQAQELWDLIVQNAWENGEPGLFFEDTANRFNNIPHIGRIRTTNPCVTGDTLIQTDRGLERMANFVEEAREDAQVMGRDGQWRGVKKFMNNGIKPVWKITTRSGYSIKATEYHKFPITFLRNGEKIVSNDKQLKNLNIGDVLCLQSYNCFDFINKTDDRKPEYEEFELLGWIVGDGYLSNKDGRHVGGLIIGDKDKELTSWFIEAIEKYAGAKCKPYERTKFNTIQLISNRIWNWAVRKMGAYPVKSGYKRVPDSVWTASEISIKAFLRGLFSADGHVRISKKGSCVILSSKSRGLIEDIQILFSMFGCRTTIMDRSRPYRDELFVHEALSGEIKHYGSDGELHELFLYGDAKLLFRNEIGFSPNSYKWEKLKQIPTENNNPYKGMGPKDQIISIECVGEEEVFDITVDDKDLSMINNGLVTIDCGEQDMLPNESCTLGHVNFKKFVIGINGTSSVDWEGLEDAVRFGMQFLDNIVEVNCFPIPELAEMNRNTRRVGLGIMGWADMLSLMGIPYDSDDAISKAHEVGEFFDKISLDECQRMGKDRGSFPYFKGSTYDGIYESMRNSDRTTIAPTGQTSMYAGRCTGGCEPMLFPVTKRNQAGMVQIDYHPALFEVLKARGLDDDETRTKLGELGSVRNATFLPEDIRASFPSAHDIHHKWHVEHQIAWQKHITSAVSKTINFHNDAKPADINQAYLQAYEGGCKGITVYRDGTRMYQPLSSLKDGSLIQIGKRSDVTQGSNRKIQNGCGNLMVYIGGDDQGVHEITARLGKGGGCAAAQTESIARMASVAMQYGAPSQKIISQLGGIRCHVTAMHRSKHTEGRPRIVQSCGDAISVALSEHIAEQDNTQAEFNDASEHVGACPECGGQLSFQEGCKGGKCNSCDFSKC